MQFLPFKKTVWVFFLVIENMLVVMVPNTVAEFQLKVQTMRR